MLGGVLEERVNNFVRRAGLNQQRTNNGTERDQNTDAADRRPHSRRKRGESIGQRDARQQRQRPRTNEQRQERMQFQPRDQHNNERDAHARCHDELPVGGVHSDGGVSCKRRGHHS